VCRTAWRTFVRSVSGRFLRKAKLSTKGTGDSRHPNLTPVLRPEKGKDRKQISCIERKS